MADNKTRIILTAEDKTAAAFASVKRGLSGLQSSASTFSRAFAGLGAGLSVAGLASFVKSSIDAADNMRDLAIATGTSVKALASYELAANQSGTSIEALAKGMGKLSVFMANNAEEAKKLGITAKDPAEAFAQLADALARAETPAQRNALAMKVLGKSYAELMPLLAQGGQALRQQSADAGPYAERMAKIAEESDKFNDAMAKLGQNSRSVGLTLANALLPSLNRIIVQMEEGIRIAGGFGNALKFGLSVNPFRSPGENLKGIQDEIKTLQTMRADLQSGAKLSVKYKDGRVFFGYNLAEIDKEIGELKKRTEFVKVLRAQALGLPSKGELGQEAARQKAAAQAALNKLPDLSEGKRGKAAKAAKDQLDVLDPFGPERRAAEKARADELRRFVEDQQESVNDLGRAMVEDGVKAAEAYQSSLENLLSNTTLAKTERMQANIDILNRAFSEGAIGVEQYDEAMAGLLESTDKTTSELEKQKGIAEELGLTFSSAFEDAVVGGKSFQDILRGIYDDLLRLTVRKSVTEPLAEGFSGLLKGFDFKSLIPSFDVGTPYVPRDTLALVHQGEAIIPAKYNKGGAGGGVTVNMTVMAQDAGSFRKSMGQIQADLAFAVNGARRFA